MLSGWPRREADPDAIPPRKHPREIVRPLLDPALRASLFSGPQYAQYWRALPQAAQSAILPLFIAAAAGQPVYHEAVKEIAIHQLETEEPLGADLRHGLVF